MAKALARIRAIPRYWNMETICPKIKIAQIT